MRRILLLSLLMAGCARTPEEVNKSLTARVGPEWSHLSVVENEMGERYGLVVRAVTYQGSRKIDVTVREDTSRGGVIELRDPAIKMDLSRQLDMIVGQYKYNAKGEVFVNQRPDSASTCTTITDWNKTTSELEPRIRDLVRCLAKSH